mmetsp:Transcript_16866/g.37231  ORF Transcript_16866/g.37231 Transcript_16866/m.37231 type:complete len:213 (-) Transcript_16866:182-820(-)
MGGTLCTPHQEGLLERKGAIEDYFALYKDGLGDQYMLAQEFEKREEEADHVKEVVHAFCGATIEECRGGEDLFDDPNELRPTPMRQATVIEMDGEGNVDWEDVKGAFLMESAAVERNTLHDPRKQQDLATFTKGKFGKTRLLRAHSTACVEPAPSELTNMRDALALLSVEEVKSLPLNLRQLAKHLRSTGAAEEDSLPTPSTSAGSSDRRSI